MSPLPLGLGLSSLGSKLGGQLLGKVGFAGQRGRTPAQNRRMRQDQVRDAEAMARAGDQFGVELLRAWTGELPSLSVHRADYRSGVGQGRMPSDGVQLAAAALDRLKADGVVTAAGRLSTGAKRAATTKGTRGAASSSAGKSAARTRAPGRGRTYVRYNPDTAERVTVTADDEPEYSEWPNRKPRASGSRSSRSTSRATTTRRRKTKTQRETDAAIRRITTEATRAGLRLSVSAARGFASMAAAAGMSSAAAAALVVGTGVAAYAATRWLINRIETVTDPAYKREQVALAYRRARLEWEKGAGRKLTQLEHDFLARNFKDALKALDAGVTFTP